MKPYLAVVLDSFHSAFSSRVLWIAILAIWVFLAGLAPIGYREVYTTEFRWFDLDNGTQLKAMLARGLVDPNEKETALGRIAQTVPEETRRSLEKVARGENIRIDLEKLSDSFNESLDDESWYDEKAWESTVRLKELRELDEIPDDEISEDLRRRRARLRIEAALPGVFAAMSSRSIMLSYAGFDFPAMFAISKSQFGTVVNQFVVPLITSWLLGFALIFLGILVTASIVPEMLQPGSLHLLLSKPLSRTMLLLAKFVGALAFVLICVCQLVIGLYLIAGLRLDLWNPRILWCIPVSVFLFAVFYSVSMLAGLRWRSSILAIGLTCIFGAVVLIIGIVGGYFDGSVRMPDRISRMAFDGDDVVVSTRGGELKHLDPETNEWDVLIERDFRRSDLIVPPVRLAEGQIATAKIRNGRFNLYGTGSLDLLMLRRESEWELEPGLRLPNGTRRFLICDDLLIGVNNAGLMATPLEKAISTIRPEDEDDGDDSEEAAEESTGSESTGSASGMAAAAWMRDLLRMQGGATDSFTNILPSGITLTEPVRVEHLPELDSLVVYSRGRLVRLSLESVDLEQKTTASTEADLLLEDENAARSLLAASGRSLLLSRQNEPLQWFDADDLQSKATLETEAGETIVSMKGIGQSGRFALLNTDGDLSLVSLRDGALVREPMSFGDVTAVDYLSDPGVLAIAHHLDRIDWVKVGEDGSLTTVREIEPAVSGWRSVDRYAITPLRTLTPQTGELSDMVAALVSGKSSFAIGQGQPDDQEVVQYKIARPVLSCGVFIVVMLTLSCVYFKRRDF
ncbi:MAG: ABC transporter permease [Planctomycetota bacterium]